MYPLAVPHLRTAPAAAALPLVPTAPRPTALSRPLPCCRPSRYAQLPIVTIPATVTASVVVERSDRSHRASTADSIFASSPRRDASYGAHTGSGTDRCRPVPCPACTQTLVCSLVAYALVACWSTAAPVLHNNPRVTLHLSARHHRHGRPHGPPRSYALRSSRLRHALTPSRHDGDAVRHAHGWGGHPVRIAALVRRRRAHRPGAAT
jgi:hypothetical protein